MTVIMTTYELELEIHADVTPGVPAILYGPPENCREGEPPTVEIERVYIVDGDKRVELKYPTVGIIEVCTQAVFDQEGGVTNP